MYKLDWQDPKTVPDIKLWSEKPFWLATAEITIEGVTSITTFLAQYQNRPFNTKILTNPKIDKDCLVDFQGIYFKHSVGWVHYDSISNCNNEYTPISFVEGGLYKLLGWAEYDAPNFIKSK